MAYINIETKQYPISEQDIRREFQNTSFSVPFQAPEGYAPVLESPLPEFDVMTQSYAEIAPEVDMKGNWMRSYQVYDLSEEQVTANQESKKQHIENAASLLLSETDWIENPSVSDTSRTPHLVNFEEFMTYRLALRAIAINPSVDAVFPEKPSKEWSV